MNSRTVWNYKELDKSQIIITDQHIFPTTIVSELFISPNLVISICHKGSLHATLDMQPMVFQPNDIAIMLPDHIIGKGEHTEDYSITRIIITRSLFEQLINRESFRGYLKYKNQPIYHLNNEQYKQITTILATLRLVVEKKHPKRIESVASLLDILFYALTDFRGDEEVDKNEQRSIYLFNSFYDLLLDNYHLQHEITWYAEKLCLTPKYFSGAIRQTTGKSAAQWIDEVLILHAKRLLSTRRDMNIQQIAFELGFKGNANFCRFFKDQTGLRPSEYRKGNNL